MDGIPPSLAVPLVADGPGMAAGDIRVGDSSCAAWGHSAAASFADTAGVAGAGAPADGGVVVAPAVEHATCLSVM